MKRLFSIFALIFALSVFASAQTTAFNFQGRLNDGSSPANGKYDLQFRLYDGLTGDNQIGAAITKSNTTLVNGVFSTQLDFGAAAFSGADRFIEIRLRSTGTENGYVILGPRQQILAVPYTVRSLKATLADDATNATNAVNAQNAANAANATNAANANSADALDGYPASFYLRHDANNRVSLPGSIIQPTNSFGLVKAMIFVNPYLQSTQKIVRCFNSQLSGTAATTVPCGFTAAPDRNSGTGLWRINFGFDISNSFLNAAVKTTLPSTSSRPTVISLVDSSYLINPSPAENYTGVLITYTDDQSWTNDPFYVFVY